MKKYEPTPEDIAEGLSAYFEQPGGNAYSPSLVVEATLRAIGPKIADEYYKLGREAAFSSVPRAQKKKSTSNSES